MKIKTCTKCSVPKQTDQFSNKNSEGTRKNSWCKSCVNDNNTKHYRAAGGREKTVQRTKIHRERNREFIREYLSKHPCVDCGEKDIIVLDFDHVKGKKKKEISKLVRDGASLETLRSEIAKCEVRCSNDHRRKTYARRLSLPCSSMVEQLALNQ